MKQRIWNLKLQSKLLLGLVVMEVVLVAALTPTISWLYRSQMESYYTQQAFDQASIAASLIDGDRIRNYYPSGEKDVYYEQIRQYLLTVKQAMGRGISTWWCPKRTSWSTSGAPELRGKRACVIWTIPTPITVGGRADARHFFL